MSPALAKVIEKIEQAGLADFADVPLDSAKHVAESHSERRSSTLSQFGVTLSPPEC